MLLLSDDAFSEQQIVKETY